MSRTLALSALKTLSLHLQSHVWRSSTDHGLQPTNENSRPTGAVAIGDLTHNRVSNAVDVTDPTLNSERSPSIRSTNTFKMELSSFSKRLQARLQRTGSWASRSTFLTADTSQTHRSDVTYVTVNSCAPNTKAYDHPIGPDTKWQAYLRLEGLDPSPRSVIDWSRRGQHVEYHRGEKVPLEPVELLGQGGAAYVESVKCGRILLARKSMRCSARLKREACIQEAKILDKLRHPHLIQLVGTYVQGNTLSILMYPVADCGSLDVFLEQCYREVRNPLVHEYRPLHDRSLLIRPLLIRPLDDRMFALKKFPKCLAMALNFVHENLVKHMDIKPKNILIKKVDDSEDFYRVYIADFGISRTYSDDADTKTDGPTSFTRTYCAPEVAAGEARGRSADIYSLGCVYAEIFTVLAGKRVQDLAEHLGGPFYMNSPKVVSWVGKLEWPPWLAYKYKDEDHSAYSHTAQSLIGLMLKDEPSARATHDLIKSMLDELPDWLYRDDSCCSRVPEKYECYQGLLDEGPIYS
ncbi:MAG: hypothetical protein M1812_000786 [Candelaria pacifica]|nr:MAG: hypothetical protein M1812_000786 [Candelaria pacifica]